MDINQLRVAVTLVSLALFIGIMVWTFQGRRRAGFDAAAQLPFADDAARSPAEPRGQVADMCKQGACA
jgi:cytochrome c oxidase cbb3-type subunit IV